MTAPEYHWPPHPPGALLYYQCGCGREWFSREPGDAQERDLRAHVAECGGAVDVESRQSTTEIEVFDLGAPASEWMTLENKPGHDTGYPQDVDL